MWACNWAVTKLVWIIKAPLPPLSSPRGAALPILIWEAEARFCGAPHYIWTCGQISQPPSITLTFTTSPSPLLLHPPPFLSHGCSARRPPVHARFNMTAPDRREAHTERIYQPSSYEGSGNLNIHCWHCADLAEGQSGPATPETPEHSPGLTSSAETFDS